MRPSLAHRGYVCLYIGTFINQFEDCLMLVMLNLNRDDEIYKYLSFTCLSH